jgi:hypothetical protein
VRRVKTAVSVSVAGYRGRVNEERLCSVSGELRSQVMKVVSPNTHLQSSSTHLPDLHPETHSRFHSNVAVPTVLLVSQVP